MGPQLFLRLLKRNIGQQCRRLLLKSFDVAASVVAVAAAVEEPAVAAVAAAAAAAIVEEGELINILIWEYC